ncbi:hypothetical protein GQR58_000291 [Nymphon striatum]|nr:hypothetical protein GQR58_000291 [Nymphon striatum]
MALGACTTSNDPVYTSFYREAGALVDTGHFGNATMNNTMIMNGERQYTYDLSNRFATEVMTTVNFAFNSAQLDGGARDTLREQAIFIRQFPEVRALVARGLEAVVSFGESQPLIVTQGRERRNRRTVTEVSGFVTSHPTVMDGNYAKIVYRDYVRSAVPPTQLSGIEGSDFKAYRINHDCLSSGNTVQLRFFGPNVAYISSDLHINGRGASDQRSIAPHLKA